MFSKLVMMLTTCRKLFALVYCNWLSLPNAKHMQYHTGGGRGLASQRCSVIGIHPLPHKKNCNMACLPAEGQIPTNV